VNAPAGNLNIFVSLVEHPVFKCDGNNLRIDRTIDLTEALLGTNFTVIGIDKAEIPVTVDSCVQPGDIITVKGAGLGGANGKARGDLLVKINIKMTDSLSDKAKKLVKELADEMKKKQEPPTSNKDPEEVKTEEKNQTPKGEVNKEEPPHINVYI
jgi:DnaJ-class molecular chaperone